MTRKEIQSYLDNCYEYETNNDDAADNYMVIFQNNPDLEKYFDNVIDYDLTCVFINVYRDNPGMLDSIFLGQGEIEAQLPEPLTKSQIEWVNHNLDWVVNESNPNLAYRLYPSNLGVGLFPNRETAEQSRY